MWHAFPFRSRIPRRLMVTVPLVVLAPGGCDGGPSGPRVLATPDCAGPHAAPLALEVGEAAFLSPDEAECLWLTPPQPGAGTAAYALAWADPRPARRAETEPEPRAFSGYEVQVRGGGEATAGAAAPSLRPARRSPVADAPDPAFEAMIQTRTRPWVVGERVEWGSGGEGSTARVLATFEDHLVVMLLEADEEELRDDWRAALDLALTGVSRTSVPLLRATLAIPFSGQTPHPERPVSSWGANQLVIFARALAHSTGQVAPLTPDSVDDVLPIIHLSLGSPDEDEALFHLLTRKVARAWQYRYLFHTRPQAAPIPDFALAPAWAMEGVADLLATEALRRRLEIGLVANWDWQCCGSGEPGGTYARTPARQEGRLLEGAGQAGPFLLDLAVRQVTAGAGLDAAFREVARGALEGWHGFGFDGAVREGLTARMRELGDEEWLPEDALVLYALSQAMDDRTGNPLLQNHSFFRVWDGPPGEGWRPAGELVLGSAGEAVIPMPGGSLGYLLLEVPAGSEGALEVSAPQADGGVWAVGRWRE